jgi:hypothetical protein
MKYVILLALIAITATAAEKYSGPRPPQPDLPYLVHADNLVPTETAEASKDSGKKDDTYTINGATSPARTPVAEPIFLLQSEKILPDRLELYRFEVKNGHRELQVSKAKRRGTHALHLQVTKLDGNLYKVEASEPLENGQYSLSPNDSNKVFCFEVY